MQNPFLKDTKATFFGYSLVGNYAALSRPRCLGNTFYNLKVVVLILLIVIGSSDLLTLSSGR